MEANRAGTMCGVRQPPQKPQLSRKSPLRNVAAYSDRPAVVGTWDAHDSWESRRTKVPEPQSTYDINFRSRPPNDMVIRVAHVATDRSGKQVVQTPVNPADNVDFPNLVAAQPSQPDQGVLLHTQWIEMQEEKSMSPWKQNSTKRSEVASSPTTLTKTGSNVVIGKPTSSPLVIAKIDSTSQITSPSSVHLPPPAADESSALRSTGILRYFQPVKPTQTQTEQANKSKSSILHYFHPTKSAQLEQLVEVVPEVKTPMRDPAPAPLPPAKPSQGFLCTQGADFLAQVEKSGVFHSFQKSSPASQVQYKSVTPSGSSPAQPTMMQDESQKQDEVKQGPAGHSSSAFDEIVAGINAMAMPRVSISNSNISVRAREDDKLSNISVSLSFDDVFQGHNASTQSGKGISVILYERRCPRNPYQTGDGLAGFEPGQLQGWDGNWAPAPVEWDTRDQFDYRKSEHQEAIKNFVINRYKEYRKGLCPALNIHHEHFTSGDSLAVGLPKFVKPIDPKEHHHIRAADPFTLNHLHQTAHQSTESYVRGHKRLFPRKEEIPKYTEAEKKAMKESYEQMLRDTPPNKFKPIMNIYIRPARVADLLQIRNIHNHWTRESVVTSERVELTDREWRTRFDDCEEERYPFIVAVNRHGRTAQRTEHVVGFAYAEDFGGEQGMWRHTCELQLFVDPHHLRKGVGKNLMDVILRGLNPLYTGHDGVPFIYSQDELNRHEGGGARNTSNIVISMPYVAKEKTQSQWLWDWLERVFEFEMQGNLKGVGRKGDLKQPYVFSR
ncbi:MAG: hypothetical protein Q9170_006570 [Blastenia crenularia]